MDDPQDFSLRTTPTFVHDALLVASAIPDSVLVFRGPTCVETRCQKILSDHDWGAGALGARTLDRVRLTGDTYASSATGTEELVLQATEQAVAEHHPSLVLLAELSWVTLAGEQLSALAREVSRRHGVPCVAITSAGFTRDHTDARQSALLGLASAIERSEAADHDTTRVGVVGYSWLRHEGDCRGDVTELASLVEALGAALQPVWLGGAGWTDLQRIREATTLVALPSGQAPARRIAETSGATVLDLGLPVGTSATAAWLRGLGQHLGAEALAERAIEEQQRRTAATLDTVVTQHLIGKRAVVIASDDWLPGIVQCFEHDLGIEVACAIRRQRSAPADATEAAPAGLSDPSVTTLNQCVADAQQRGGVDFIVGSWWERVALQAHHGSLPFLEFGFPQHTTHFLTSRAHLGYTGVLNWAERIMEL